MCVGTPDLLCLLLELADSSLVLFEGEYFRVGCTRRGAQATRGGHGVTSRDAWWARRWFVGNELGRRMERVRRRLLVLRRGVVGRSIQTQRIDYIGS